MDTDVYFYLHGVIERTFYPVRYILNLSAFSSTLEVEGHPVSNINCVVADSLKVL